MLLLDYESVRACRQFIALYSTMSIARARFCLVQVQLDAREAGKAAVVAKHAENELAQCTYVAEGNKAWTDAFNALLVCSISSPCCCCCCCVLLLVTSDMFLMFAVHT